MPRFRIVSVNDVYSLENLPRLKSLVDVYKARSDAEALVVVLAGDFVAPSLLSSIDFGRGMVDCLNAVGITHVVLGNHEDDIPGDELRSRLRELEATCLGTNVRSVLDLPRHVVIDVGEDRVGIVGATMADPSVYRGRPFGGAELLPANDALREEVAALVRTGIGVVVALTHQEMAHDRELATLQKAPAFAAIIGGHEHVAVLERAHSTWIVKAGMDATHAAITDIEWSEANRLSPLVTTHLEDVATYPEDESLRARVDHHMAAVRELADATLHWVEPGHALSSKGTRSRQTTMGTMICTRLRNCLGADASVFNGGGIRGARDYPVRFTYGDIEAEVPFDNEVVVVALPGFVLEDAIIFSRANAPVESGAFLQVDDGIVLDERNAVLSIAGAPFDPLREYRVALVRELLLGLDGVEPLVRWAKDNARTVPPPDSGRQPKLILVQSFVLGIWRDLGGFDAIDTDGDDRVTPSELAAAVAKRHPSQAPKVLADLVLKTIDADADSIISRADAMLTGSLHSLDRPGSPEQTDE